MIPENKRALGRAAAARIGLRTRIYLLLGALCLVNLAGPLLMFWYVNTARDLYTATVGHDLEALLAAQELDNALLNQKGYATYFLLSNDQSWLARLDESRKSFDAWLDKARQEADADQAARLLEDIQEAYAAYTLTKKQVIALYMEGRADAGRNLHWEVRKEFDRIKEVCDRLKDLYRTRMRASGREYVERSNLVMALTFAGMSVNLVLGLVLAYVLVKQILDPIRRLARSKEYGGITESFSDEVKALGHKFRNLLKDMDQAHLDLEESRGHLMQSEKLAMAGKLAAGVAHTIRNPLTSVKMRLFSLERTLKLDLAQREDLEVISEEIGHIDTIVRNFLEFARPPKLKAQPVSLSDVVDTVIKLLKHRLESYGVTVVLDRQRRLPEIDADPDQLKEALVNLVLNACEAMGEGGVITIREETGFIEPQGKIVVIRVSDTGPGIPAAIGERVFTPFFTTKGEGSGLGLPIVRRIVEEHGGWVTLHSPEGKGAAFALVFPHNRERGWHRY